MRIVSQLEFLELPAGTAFIDRDSGGLSVSIKGTSAPPGGVASDYRDGGLRIFFWKTAWKICAELAWKSMNDDSDPLRWAYIERSDLEHMGVTDSIVDTKRSKITGECVRETPVTHLSYYYEVLEGRELEIYILELMRAWHLLNVAEATQPLMRLSFWQRVRRFFAR